MKTLASFLFLGAAFAALYGRVLVKLASDWQHDGNYSHGFVIVPLALYFAWDSRAELRAARFEPSWLGLVLVACSVLLMVGGVLGAELFATRIAMLATLAGTLLSLFGREYLRVLAFPLAFLLLMIPLPAILFNQIAFPLQLVASRFGELVLSAAGIPVLREGNVIFLAKTTLDVAEACSGIRSLISLMTIGIVYGYFADPRRSIRLVLVLATIPVAIVANGTRVAGTGIAAHYFGAVAATGFLHTFSGWLVFATSLGLLICATRVILWILPPRDVSALSFSGVSS